MKSTACFFLLFTFAGLLKVHSHNNAKAQQPQFVQLKQEQNRECSFSLRSSSGECEDSVRFLALGDWGGLPYSPFYTAIEKAIAVRMNDVAEKRDYQFVVALGDNFYFDGVTDVTDPRFKETFEDIFTGASLQRKWYILAGNHDYHANVTAQIQYTQHSKRWTFPDYNYTFVHRPDELSEPTVRFIMIDTMILCGMNDLEYPGQPPMGPSDPQKSKQMLQWIKDVLEQSREDYVIVCGHYPVYSIGPHGNTKYLEENLVPLLHHYNVTLYLNGHEHNLQHVQYTNPEYGSTVDYITVGAANFIEPSNKPHDIPEDWVKFYWANQLAFGAFAGIELGKDHGVMSFFEANGTVLYTHTLHPRPLHKPPPRGYDRF